MAAVTADGLYPGERLIEVSNAPTLCYFKPGDPTRPLVVFLPGAAHLARISYGGHHTGDATDFLAHWLTELGYNFLAISYPLDTEAAIMPPTRPDFTIADWGAQAAQVTKDAIEQHHLTKDVILLLWSMAGKVLQSYVAEARGRSINVNFAVPLVATPAIRAASEQRPQSPTDTGYAAMSSATYGTFQAMLHEQNALNENRIIIPDDVYQREFRGSFPIGLSCGIKWSDQQRSFLRDRDHGFQSAEEMPFSELPDLCTMYCDRTDLRHAITDRSTWGLLLTHKLFGQLDSKSIAFLGQNPETRERAIRLIHSAPEHFSAVVEGNHFFFLGRMGAQKTATCILGFEKKLAAFREEFSAVCG